MGCFALAVVASPLYAGTIGYYRFESGDVTGDSSGNGRTLTLAGASGSAPLSYLLPSTGAGSAFSDPIPQTGAANGYGIQGTGATQNFQKYYTLADTAIGSALTVESYVNLSNTDNTTKIIASQGANGTNGSWAFLATSEASGQGARRLLFQFASTAGTWGSNGLDSINSGISLTVGHDYYVAVAVNFSDLTASGVTFYVQDLTLGSALQIVSKTHTVTTLYDSASAISIGVDGFGASTWQGTLDEVRLSDSQLSQSQLLISVPEPATASLAFMGLGLMWVAARRNKKS